MLEACEAVEVKAEALIAATILTWAEVKLCAPRFFSAQLPAPTPLAVLVLDVKVNAVHVESASHNAKQSLKPLETLVVE